jgi:hypothetical protein
MRQGISINQSYCPVRDGRADWQDLGLAQCQLLLAALQFLLVAATLGQFLYVTAEIRHGIIV